MVYNHHRELDPVLRSEVDALTREDGVDGLFEMDRVYEADQVRDLVEAVRFVERAKSLDFPESRGRGFAGPLTGGREDERRPRFLAHTRGWRSPGGP
jgi:hypothetical protein